MKKLILLSTLIVTILANCGTTQDAISKNEIPGEILIDLAKGVKPEIIETALDKYELKQERMISPSLNIFLFKFNHERISTAKLIVKAKKIEGVENAQSNKKITKRG